MKIKGITNIDYFTKGHRGILYTGKYKNKKVVIKAKLPESQAENRIENEGKWLKRLNKYKIGPKLIKATKDYFFYEYIEGMFFIDFIKTLENNDKSKKIIIRIIKDVFEQCFILDKLKADKEEMHHPIKHIIITPKNKVFLLDFERCHIVDYSKNITQFAVFLLRLRELLPNYGIKLNQERIIALAKLYKRYQTRENFEKILNEIR